MVVIVVAVVVVAVVVVVGAAEVYTTPGSWEGPMVGKAKRRAKN